MSIKSSDYVLVSWVDGGPFEKILNNSQNDECNNIDTSIMTVLFDNKSLYINEIKHIVLLYNKTETDKKIVLDTKEMITNEDSSIKVDLYPCKIADLKDYHAIFKLFKSVLLKIRKKYSDKHLIIHISSGNSVIQSIWLLLTETGMIPEKFEVIQSFNKGERKDGTVVRKVELYFESYYKAYDDHNLINVTPIEESIKWIPKCFRSPLLKELYEKSASLAKLKAPILITGERGTGKTALASWIRFNSKNRNKSNDEQWPKILCGQYSEDILRKQLIGYKKGAFSQAITGYDGFLSIADNDTIFLDEIDKLPIDLQKLLTKAIDENKFWPLGSDKPVESNFRLIAASSLSDEEIKERLDPDFFDKISVYRLHTPSLREIREDLEWLWIRVLFKAIWNNLHRFSGDDISLYGKNDQILNTIKSEPLRGNLNDLYKLALLLVANMEKKNLSKDAIIQESIKQYQMQKHESSGANLSIDFVPSKKRIPKKKLELGAKDCLKNRIRDLEIRSVYEALNRTNDIQKEAAKLLGFENLTSVMNRLGLPTKQRKRMKKSTPKKTRRKK